MTRLGEIVRAVVEWQRATFDVRSPSGLVEHLRQEVDELSVDPTDAEELADCLILLVGIADAAGVGIDGLEVATSKKLEKNRRRTWRKPDPTTGVIRHDREG